MKSAFTSRPNGVSAVLSFEMPAHLTGRGFRRFWVGQGMRTVLILVPVAQLAPKIPSGLDVLTRPLI